MRHVSAERQRTAPVLPVAAASPRDNAATLLRTARACQALPARAATALLALAAPAQAQTAVLISNFNQAVATGTNIPVVSTIQQMAQGFTTGSSPATLTSIDLKFYVAEATTELPSMTLHSGTPTGTEVASLTSSGSLAAGLITTITFNAPANTTLTLGDDLFSGDGEYRLRQYPSRSYKVRCRGERRSDRVEYCGCPSIPARRDGDLHGGLFGRNGEE